MKVKDKNNQNNKLSTNNLKFRKKHSPKDSQLFRTSNNIESTNSINLKPVSYREKTKPAFLFSLQNIKNKKIPKKYPSDIQSYYDKGKLTINHNINLTNFNLYLLYNSDKPINQSKKEKDIINLNLFKKEPKDTIRKKILNKNSRNEKPLHNDNIFNYNTVRYFINNSFNNLPLNRTNIGFKKNKMNNIGKNDEKNTSYFSNKYLNNQTNEIIVPTKKLNLLEFTKIEQIGKGTFGKIFSVNWKVNNKKYALKKEIVKNLQYIAKRENIIKIINNFLEKTYNTGVIQIYSNLLEKKYDNYIYYELMEIGERDWEKEINSRRISHTFYTESELLNISSQLIETLSLLQKNHITHRDIKPQNILIINGQYKLCDFSEIRVMEKEGYILQRIRGSELFMSPILFNGLRAKINQVKHNTYKSDVFSFGMCLFYAASLYFNYIDEVREITDMKKMNLITNKYLSIRYSNKFISLINLMLQIDEDLRPDFIELEEKLDIIFVE